MEKSSDAIEGSDAARGERTLAGTSTGLAQIPGFIANHTYYVYFFPTRMNGQTLPSSATLSSNSSGELTIDLSSSPLGCDIINADYAYFISDVEHTWDNTRMAYQKPSVTETAGVEIIPNPSLGIFTVSLSGGFAGQCLLELYDFTGNLIMKSNKQNEGIFSLNLSSKSKGIYYLKIVTERSTTVNKLTVH